MRLRRGRGSSKVSEIGLWVQEWAPSPTLGSTEGQSRGGLVCILPSGWVP